MLRVCVVAAVVVAAAAAAAAPPPTPPAAAAFMLLNSRQVRESPAKGIYIEGVKEEPLCCRFEFHSQMNACQCDHSSRALACSDDVWALLALGDKAKAKAATAMNARSSRSHRCLFPRLISNCKTLTNIQRVYSSLGAKVGRRRHQSVASQPRRFGGK